jgi:hypothetical protein
VAPGVRVLALAPRRPPLNRGLAPARVVDGAVIAAVHGSAGIGPAPATLRVLGVGGSRDFGRALAAPGGALTLPLPVLAPGWWTGELVLEPDELRADDRRMLAWRVAPPPYVSVTPDAGPFVAAALDVLTEGGRAVPGTGVTIGDRPGPGPSVVLPPADAALLGPTNRALAARGATWRFGAEGTPGLLASDALGMLAGVPVARRRRLDGGSGDSAAVLARVNGEPWLVRAGDLVLVASRLDTTWTALPARPPFVPFVEALVSRVARGEEPVTDVEGPPGVAFVIRGTDTVGATVSGPDARESDLVPAEPDVAAEALDGGGGEGALVLDDAAFATESYAGVRRADVSGVLLVLALLLVGAETWVAARTR